MASCCCSANCIKDNGTLKRYTLDYWKELKGRTLTKPTILLLLYMFAVNTCTVVAYQAARTLTSSIDRESCYEHHSRGSKSTNNIINISRNVLFFMIPLAGWLADTRIGRGTAITISLWTGWMGTLLQALSAILQYRLCGDPIELYAFSKYCLSTTSLVLMVVSVSFCYANIFSFGLSQLLLVGGSSVKNRAFVKWTVWIIFLSANPIFVGTFINYDDPFTYNIAVSTFAFTIFCLCLSLHFNLNHRFENVQVINHYQLLYKVLKYTWKHKQPEKRSAMTYWEDSVPSRMDYAKNCFGGPFTHENVETVKTFLRVLLVLLSLVPFLIASDPIINGMPSFVGQFKNGTQGLGGLADYFVWFIGDDVILIAVPLLEIIILPLFPKLEFFLINPLKGLGLSMIFLLLSMISLLTFDVIGRLLVDKSIPCYSIWSPTDPQLGLSFWVVLIPAVFAGLADMLSFLCMFEFLCSQSPSGMSGMLIGLFWFLRSICSDIGAVILILFNINPPSALPKGRLSCTSFSIFVLGFIAVCGLVLYVVVAHGYVKRVRNADLKLRVTIEQHIEKQIQSDQGYTISIHDIETENVTLSAK